MTEPVVTPPVDTPTPDPDVVDPQLVSQAREVAAQVQRELLDRNDEHESLMRAVREHEQQTAVQEAKLHGIHAVLALLANIERELKPLVRWMRDENSWRQTCCDELEAMPRRIYDGVLLGKRMNLMASIKMIDGYLESGSGFELENLRVGQLLREAGYQESPRIDNQISGQLPWYGNLPDTEWKVKELRQRHRDAVAQLTNLLLSPEEQARRAQEQLASRAVTPQRKTRGDGSEYLKYPDGKIEEVTAAPAPTFSPQPPTVQSESGEPKRAEVSVITS